MMLVPLPLPLQHLLVVSDDNLEERRLVLTLATASLRPTTFRR